MIRGEVRRQKLKDTSAKAAVRASRTPPFVLCPLPLDLMVRSLPSTFCLLLTAFCFLFTSCKVGPNYSRPPAPTPTAYKELPPPNSPQSSEWAPAQPNDAIARGKWWEIYSDMELKSLEDQVSISNQNVVAAEAQFR